MCHASSFIFTSFLPTRVSCLRLRIVSYIASAGSHYWQLKRSSVSQEAHSRPMWPAQHPRLNRNPVHSCSARICVLGGWPVFYLARAKPTAALEKYSDWLQLQEVAYGRKHFRIMVWNWSEKNTFQNKAVYACINYSQVLKDFFVISRGSYWLDQLHARPCNYTIKVNWDAVTVRTISQNSKSCYLNVLII